MHPKKGREDNVRTHAEMSVLPEMACVSDPGGQLVHAPLLIELYVSAGHAVVVEFTRDRGAYARRGRVVSFYAVKRGPSHAPQRC